MDIKEGRMKIIDSIYLAQDRDKCGTIVKSVIV